MRSDPGWEGSRDCQLWGNDAGTGAHGGMAESPTSRVGGDGEYGSLLDCSPRDIGSPRFQNAAGGYTPTGAGAGSRQEDRPNRLRVDSAAAQLWVVARFVPAGGNRVHAADAGAR